MRKQKKEVGIQKSELNRRERDEKKKLFLKTFGDVGRIDISADNCHIGRNTVYKWIREDKKFAADLDAAKVEACLSLEDEAVRRARYGVDKPVYQRGVCVGHVREYSDTLLIFLLKCWNRARYGDRSQLGIEIPKGTIPIKLSVEDDGPPLEPVEPDADCFGET